MVRARSWVPALAWLTLALVVSGCAKAQPPGGLRPLPPLGDYWSWIPESLQPRLRWEAFPRPEDIEADKSGRLAGVRNVSYELRIWRADRESSSLCGACFPTEAVYVRGDLAGPDHTVESPLAPGTIYLWSARAHFELDGQPRVTQWGGAARGTAIPTLSYYRFTTPMQ